MQRWTLIIEGTRYPLSDITYEVFVAYFWKTGASDTEYEKFLRYRGQYTLTDFNADALKHAEVEVYDDFDGRTITMNVKRDSDTEDNEDLQHSA